MSSLREVAILELHRCKMTRSVLSSQAVLSRSYVSHLLSGATQGGRQAWDAILKVLGLELTVRHQEE